MPLSHARGNSDSKTLLTAKQSTKRSFNYIAFSKTVMRVAKNISPEYFLETLLETVVSPPFFSQPAQA